MTSGWLFQVRSARRCMLCFPVEESGWGCFSTTPVWLICSFLSVCASSIHFVLPSAGWQRHRVERDALVVGSPHGSRLSHRACLQSSSGGIKGNTRLSCFWKLVWNQSLFRIFHFNSKMYRILKMWHQPFLISVCFLIVLCITVIP